MFTAIFGWMLSHVPGFMRAGVNWLLDGLRRITTHISSRWNTLGAKALYWVRALAYFRDRLLWFTGAVVDIVVYLKSIYIPRLVNSAILGLLRVINVALRQLENLALSAIGQLRRWAESAINAVGRLLSGVREWAAHWIAEIRGTISLLIRGLRHVLGGPAALAEWLAAAMAKALGRWVFSQRERFLSWLLRESIAWTRWLSREIETLLLRWL